MSGMDRRESAALDRYITGNYGEDQFTVDEVMREPHSYLEAPDDSGCFMCGAEEFHEPILAPVIPMAAARLDVGAGNRQRDVRLPMYALLEGNGGYTTTFGEHQGAKGHYYPMVALWTEVRGDPFMVIYFSWDAEASPVKTVKVELPHWYQPDGRDLIFPVPLWEELI